MDNLLTGTADTPVQGIATTMMATLDVVERSVAQGENMIITHETPFYLHQDNTDGIEQGMVNQLGWQKNVSDTANPRKLIFNGIPLAKFARQMRKTLGARTLRVLGDPNLPVRRVTTSWGYCGREGGIKLFSDPDTDVLICGETREWELVEYCQDSIRSGNKKALVVVGHVLSEQGGMILCRDWLKPFIPEVPIEFVAATEPFWIPNHPARA